MSIGELGRRVGAPPSALRYWERAGLLEAERVDGRRRYEPDAVTRVGVIRLCQDAGFGIAEIRALLDTDPRGEGAWRDVAAEKLADLHTRITRLRTAALALEHVLGCTKPSLAACPRFGAYVHWRAEGGDPPPEAAAQPGEG